MLAVLTLLSGEPRPCTTFALVGDVMLGRGVAQSLGDAWDEAFVAVRPWLTGADVALANLESPLTRRQQLAVGNDLRAAPEAVQALEAGGFDAVSVANNHSLDAGVAGLLDTMRALCVAGIVPIPDSLSAGNLVPDCTQSGQGTFRVLAFDDSVAPLDLRMAEDLVKRASDETQIVLVSVHWGGEYQTAVTQRQEEVATALAGAGATLVVGHGPHILQRMEWIGGTLVAYSLGNFIFDQRYPTDCRWGAVLMVAVCGGDVTAVQVLPTVTEEGRVQPAGLDVRPTIESVLGLNSIQYVP